MKIKIKLLHPDAVMPKYAKQGDNGMDLTAVSVDYVDKDHVRYNFGLALEIPEGYVGLIFPRSSIYKSGQLMSNSVGVIDSSYRGEISTVMLGNYVPTMYRVRERCAQLVIVPCPNIELVQVEELSETERGSKGYGSTGK